MFFICHTDLVESFKDLFGDSFDYDGNRALLFSVDTQRPRKPGGKASLPRTCGMSWAFDALAAADVPAVRQDCPSP